MKTYSQLLNRPAIDLSENQFRAGTNEIAFGRTDAYADSLRVSNPSTRLFTYVQHRLATPPIAAQFIADTPGHETGFIHHAGIRRVLPASGWYVMNMSDAGWLAWRRARTILVVKGLDPLTATHTTWMDATDYDNVLWYPAFDTGPNENILTSDEYSGTGDLYQVHCKDDFIATHAAVLAATGAHTVPNFGDISFAAAVNANKDAIISAALTVRVETSLRYDVDPITHFCALEVPNATDALTRWAFIDATCSNKELLAQGFLDHPPQAQADKDKANVGTACFFALADSPNLYTRFISDISEPAAHISTWENNSFARNAKLLLGNPVNARIEVGTTATKVRVFQREFENGFVYLSLQKLGQSGNELVVVEIPVEVKTYNVDGSFSPLSTSFSLNEGDGLVLIKPAIEPPPPPPPPPGGSGGPGPGGIIHGKRNKKNTILGFSFAAWPRGFKNDFKGASTRWERDARKAFKKKPWG